MAYLIGIGLAVAFGVLAWVAGLDRSRGFYAALLMVVATYYILFAVLGGGTRALVAESAASAIFLALAVVGFKKSMWLIAAGLAGHGVFDLVHPRIIEDAGVPAWWPGFCMAFDVAAGGIVAMLVVRRGGWRPGR